MALIHKLFGKSKTLSDLSRQELRKEELLLTRQRDKLLTKINSIAGEKQKIFKQGSVQKTPELRKALAQDFELRTQEQLMAARELSMRSKEMLTVSRLRMVKENQGRGKALGRLKVTDKDVARISRWIEDDSISQEMYQERLDSILEIGALADKEALGGASLSADGNELLNIWNQMDRGKLKQDEGFEQAEQALRQKHAAKEGQ